MWHLLTFWLYPSMVFAAKLRPEASCSIASVPKLLSTSTLASSWSISDSDSPNKINKINGCRNKLKNQFGLTASFSSWKKYFVVFSSIFKLTSFLSCLKLSQVEIFLFNLLFLYLILGIFSHPQVILKSPSSHHMIL